MIDGATIIALSSGAPPAAIGIIRISGPRAGFALTKLCGRLPPPRVAALRTVRDPVSADILDRTLVFWFPGPKTSSGEDLAEIHAHGGRAVVAAILRALAGIDGVRYAEPGEFTRRAFANGVIDLAQAEGLADLLSAETESQRRNAQLLAGGALSRRTEAWQERLLGLSAVVEALLEFGEEEGIEDDPRLATDISALAHDIGQVLARPGAERLKDGIRVVLAGPPNAGKSTLLNALVEREAAIISDIPGTTRDLIQAPTAIAGIPFVFIDTAGLREGSADAIERIGMGLAESAIQEADILLWLGVPDEVPDHPRALRLHAQCDLRPSPVTGTDLAISAWTFEGMASLVDRILELASDLIPAGDSFGLNRRQGELLGSCVAHLYAAAEQKELVLRAEELQGARHRLDQLTGRAGTEEMLDTLFGRFCIGK
jgi:tRNA modification GTPase